MAFLSSMSRAAPGYPPAAAPVVQVWFGDPAEQELRPNDMYLAVYAAGGGKRNMANFVRTTAVGGEHAPFRPSDVHVFLSSDGAEITAENSRFFICRWASARGEWVPKAIPCWSGESQLKLVPEWFKARFWDNKQEKKHPWFMFACLTEADGMTQLFTSSSFPVHQYYPTGVKKTDPNDAGCRAAFHKVLKTAPPTSLRPEHLLRKAGAADGRGYAMLPTPPASGSPSGEFWASDDTASEDGERPDVYEEFHRKRKLAGFASWGADGGLGHGYVERRVDGRCSRARLETADDMAEDDPEQVGAAQALLALRLSHPMR